MENQLQVTTFGVLSFALGERPLPALLAQRQRAALLVYLAVEGHAQRETLCDVLWPDRPADHARRNLTQTLYHLRRTIGDRWLEAEGDRLSVTSAVTVDSRDFERRVNKQDFANAVSLYNGVFLSNFYLPDSKQYELWVDRQRARLSRMYRRAAREYNDELVRQGRVTEALALARHWVDVEPQEDEAHQKLIELLARGGMRGDALAHYEYYRSLLAVDQLEPLPQTAELVEQVKAGVLRAQPRSTMPVMATLVAAVRTATADPATRSDSSYRLARTWLRRTRDLRSVLVAVVAVTLVALAVAASVGTPPGRPAAQIRSIAVLPFVNLSDDPQASDYFSDGLTEELISTLGEMKGLSVAARSSSFAYKGKEYDARELGRRLGVEGLVQASVRRHRTSIRVAAQLVDARTGYQIWSRRFDRELRDVILLQDEIAREIAGALELRLSPRMRTLAAARTTDLDAYELYLKGRHAWSKRDPAGVKQAAIFFEEAIARDTTFALAHSGLADAYALGGSNRYYDRTEAYTKAYEAAGTAVRLDPLSAEAHASLGRVYADLMMGGITLPGKRPPTFEDSEREFKQAIALNSRYPFAHSWYAGLLSWTGRSEAAIGEGVLAERLEPMSPAIALLVGEVYEQTGENERAIAQYRRAMSLNDTWPLTFHHLGSILFETRRFAEVVPIMERGLGTLDYFPGTMYDGFRARLAIAYVATGRTTAARALLQQLEQEWDNGKVAPLWLAQTYLAFGNNTKAVETLEVGWRERRFRETPIFLDTLTAFAPLRSEPRFQSLLRELGLPGGLKLRDANAPAERDTVRERL